ncbi:sensor histidine kinase [Spirosoma koreense]
MSLLGQTARYLLLVACGIALIGSVAFYELIHQKIQYEVDEILLNEVQKTGQRLQTQPIGTIVDWDDNPHIERIAGPVPAQFSDIVLNDSLTDNQPVAVRQYQASVMANGRWYLVRYRQPYLEFSELTQHLSIGVIIGFLLLMGLSVAVGLGFARRLWHPFYATLDQLSNVQLDGPVAPSFPDDRIREFALLNRSLGELTTKLRAQFTVQKQFTENASHELQTPLAIATAELDLLLQSPRLGQEDHLHLQRATDALNRLSQLNRSLLLLMQVENNQFAIDEQLDISTLVRQCTDEFTPFFAHKRLAVTQSITPAVRLRMNRQLAGVLLTNLLKNTARHTPVGGNVNVSLTPDALVIANTGQPLPFAADELFNRFVKDPTHSDSLGLGLALVKQICDRYGLPLQYRYDSARQLHTFQVGLRPLPGR